MSEPPEVFPADQMRTALLAALRDELAAEGEAPRLRHFYVPLRHAQAISPEHGLVVGNRGTGKSVLWAALQSEVHREAIRASLPSASVGTVAKATAGFGVTPRSEDYPDKRTLHHLLREGRNPADIWRGIIASQTWGRADDAGSELRPSELWHHKLAWLDAHPEQTARRFELYDAALAERGEKHLVLFDALDRVADEWKDRCRLLRGLLQTLLDFRAYRAIRTKVFVRPYMLSDPEVMDFPDSSKLLAGKADLLWQRVDLYGLFFHRLGNSLDRVAVLWKGWQTISPGVWQKSGSIWQVPRELRESDKAQRRFFQELAGPWMGRDHRFGSPYLYLPNRLADANGQVSPRVFMTAIRAAAEKSHEDHSWAYPLHHQAIRSGVHEAARIRVAEVKEDFSWLATAMDPLHGLVLPCDLAEIAKRWADCEVISKLEQLDPKLGLLPKRLQEGVVGLCDDLIELGLFSRQPDGRINMPDVYRVGFGLGRRGGVKPIR